MIDINLVIITTNHIYIGAVYIMSGLIGGSIGSIDVVFGAFWGISIGFMSSIIKFLLLLYILLPLMLCSSDMIFPRLNALSLWIDTIPSRDAFILTQTLSKAVIKILI